LLLPAFEAAALRFWDGVAVFPLFVRG